MTQWSPASFFFVRVCFIQAEMPESNRGKQTMTIAQIMEKMIAFSEGNIHDITHLSCVWTYAKTIGELEGVDAETQLILEVAAITHDIACPLCRKKYGNTNGRYQEQEGDPLVRDFVTETGLSCQTACNSRIRPYTRDREPQQRQKEGGTLCIESSC